MILDHPATPPHSLSTTQEPPVELVWYLEVQRLLSTAMINGHTFESFAYLAGATAEEATSWIQGQSAPTLQQLGNLQRNLSRSIWWEELEDNMRYLIRATVHEARPAF